MEWWCTSCDNKDDDDDDDDDDGGDNGSEYGNDDYYWRNRVDCTNCYRSKTLFGGTRADKAAGLVPNTTPQLRNEWVSECEWASVGECLTNKSVRIGCLHRCLHLPYSRVFSFLIAMFATNQTVLYGGTVYGLLLTGIPFILAFFLNIYSPIILVAQWNLDFECCGGSPMMWVYLLLFFFYS